MSDFSKAKSNTEEGETPSARVIRRSYDYITFRTGRIVVVFVGLTLLFGIFSGLHKIELDENGVLRRFGKVVDRQIQPGLHWHLPFGIDQVDTFKVAVLHRLEVDAHISPTMSTFTGDVNFVDARFVVQYKVKDLSKYLFNSSAPVSVIMYSVKSAFVDIIAGMFVGMALVTEKKRIEKYIFDSVQREVDKLRLGLEIISVNTSYLSPPADAVPAFRSVNDAKAEKNEIMERAVRRRLQSLAQAKGVAANIVDNARAEAEGRIAQAKNEAAKFNAILKEKIKSPGNVIETQYWDRVKRLFSRARLLSLKSGTKSDLAVNLMESESFFSDKSDVQGRGGENSHNNNMGGHAHPGSQLSHVMEDVSEDRNPRGGGHRPGMEAHHYGPVPDVRRSFPKHQLDSDGSSPVRSRINEESKKKSSRKSRSKVRGWGRKSKDIGSDKGWGSKSVSGKRRGDMHDEEEDDSIRYHGNSEAYYIRVHDEDVDNLEVTDERDDDRMGINDFNRERYIQ